MLNQTIDSSEYSENKDKLSCEPRSKDIAIIGMSLKFPQADNVNEFWENIKNGMDCIIDFPESRRIDTDNYLNFSNKGIGNYTYQIGAYLNEIDKFDCQFFGISPKEASLMDPNQRLFLEIAWGAIEDAGYCCEKLSGSRTGVYLGLRADKQLYPKLISEAEPSSAKIAFSGGIAAIIPSRVSYQLDLIGPAMFVDTACSSSLVAVHLACQGIRNGDCSLAIAGGVVLEELPLEGGEKIGIESSNGKTRTFDNYSDGTGMGEGVAAIVLKSLNDAIKDRDNIYAVIKGSAVNQDGKSIGITAPNPNAQEDVIINAWRDADVDPETISYIEAHGTGTKLGDPTEILGIKKAFRRYTNKNQFCAIGSVKTNIGHQNNLAGLAGLIKAVMSLKNKKIPPMINFNIPNRRISFHKSPVYINDCLAEWFVEGSPRRCGVSAFGISGTNCHIVLEETLEYFKNKPGEFDQGTCILTISAKTKYSLRELIKKYINYMNSMDKDCIEDVCYTSNMGRGSYNYRIAIITRGFEDLIQKLKHISENDFNDIHCDEVFYKEHRISRGIKKVLENTEITAEEKSNLNKSSKELMDEYIKTRDEKNLYELCRVYVKGGDVEWKYIYKDAKRKRVSLPSYSFERNRCWLDIESLIEQNLTYKNSEISLNNNEKVMITGKENQEDYSENEMLIAKIWGNVLGYKKVNVYDDFFEMGGNSLIAIKLEVEIEKHGFEIESRDLYQYPSINKLCLYLEERQVDSNKILNSHKENNQHTVNKPLNMKSHNINHIKQDESLNKVLNNFEPFNDIFYKNCFYNSLFPVIKHFNKDILPVLVNDTLVYSASEEESSIKITTNFLENLRLDIVLKDMGILSNQKEISGDIISDIISSISNSRPVVLWIDCFYESIRNDMYQKSHWPHTILIYGFNQREKTFNIIEHMHRDNLSYGEKTIKFEDIVNSYNSYLELFYRKFDVPTLYECYKIDKLEVNNSNYQNKNEKYVFEFLNNIRVHSEKMLAGLEHLNGFVKDYEELVLNQSVLEKNSAVLLNRLNNIITSKETELYKIQRIFDVGSACFSILETIISDWRFIRSVVAKYIYTANYNRNKFITSINTLQGIYVNEYRYYNHLIEMNNNL